MTTENFIAHSHCIFKESDIFINIDPGHGGLINKRYVTAPSKMAAHEWGNFYEGVFNRSMALAVISACNYYKVSYGLTTVSNYDMSIKDRVAVARNYQLAFPEKKHCFISLHGNADRTGRAEGVESWSDRNNNDSDILGLCILKQFESLNMINRGEKDKNFTAIYEAGKHMIAILLEIGFFTNSEEALRMQDPKFQSRAGILILKGIINFYKNKK